MTRKGEKECGEEGDYLSWHAMEWQLKGEAKIEMVNSIDPCKKEPEINVYMLDYLKSRECFQKKREISWQST